MVASSAPDGGHAQGEVVAADPDGVAGNGSRLRAAVQAIAALAMAINAAPTGWVGRLAPVVAMPRAAPRR